MKRLLTIFMFSVLTFSVKAQKAAVPLVTASKEINGRVEKQPQFPGGQKAFYTFLSKNLRWPQIDQETYGTVIIGFTVEKDGRLTNYKVIKHLSAGQDGEALRVIKLSTKWIPAMRTGKPIQHQYSVPIKFILTE